MATGKMRYYSLAQAGQTNFRYVLPCDVPPEMVQGNRHFERPAKNLYLLHGFSGNEDDWEYNGVAEDIAVEYNLNVFMISAGNSFYLDREATGCQFATFAGEEIVAFTRKLFGLSDRREDTLIGGLSMGGFGALHTGLAYPDTFGGILALSSAYIIHSIAGMKPEDVKEGALGNYAYYREMFGDLDRLEASDANPEVLYERLTKEKRNIPSIYMAVGTEDMLYASNQELRGFLEQHQADMKYEEGPGIHDWRFWNHYVKNGVEWLLERNGGI